MAPRDSASPLSELLLRHRPALLAFVEREAKGLLGYESAEDLAQGIQLRALGSRATFEFRGEKEFLGWLLTIARRYVADRHDYWSARRRDAGRALRVTAGGSGTRATRAGVDPPSPAAGPATAALRREQIALAVGVLEGLPPRDRDLVRWMSQGVSIDEMATRLGLSYEAAKHAQARAIERFRKAFELVSRHADPRAPRRR